MNIHLHLYEYEEQIAEAGKPGHAEENHCIE
jgi:hypothetical protein